MRAIVLLFLALLCGCTSVSDSSELLGRYELASKTVRIALELRPDHSYTETVKYADGSEERSANRWDWWGCLGVKSFLMPPIDGLDGDEPVTGESAQRLHLHRTARGTNQLDLCLAAEKHFGRAELIPNPDRSAAFLRLP